MQLTLRIAINGMHAFDLINNEGMFGPECEVKKCLTDNNTKLRYEGQYFSSQNASVELEACFLCLDKL